MWFEIGMRCLSGSLMSHEHMDDCLGQEYCPGYEKPVLTNMNEAGHDVKRNMPCILRSYSGSVEIPTRVSISPARTEWKRPALCLPVKRSSGMSFLFLRFRFAKKPS